MRVPKYILGMTYKELVILASSIALGVFMSRYIPTF